jgi:hypothetical protein
MVFLLPALQEQGARAKRRGGVAAMMSHGGAILDKEQCRYDRKYDHLDSVISRGCQWGVRHDCPHFQQLKHLRPLLYLY